MLESDVNETNYLINEDFTITTQQPHLRLANTNTSSTTDDILDLEKEIYSEKWMITNKHIIDYYR